MCLADYSIKALCFLPRSRNGVIPHFRHCVRLPFFVFASVRARRRSRVLYYSTEKTTSPWSLIEFPMKLRGLFKTQICHFARKWLGFWNVMCYMSLELGEKKKKAPEEVLVSIKHFLKLEGTHLAAVHPFIIFCRQILFSRLVNLVSCHMITWTLLGCVARQYSVCNNWCADGGCRLSLDVTSDSCTHYF